VERRAWQGCEAALGMPVDSHARSVLKAVSWRLVGSLDTFLLSWILTQHVKVAASITAVELFTKICLYWLHERIWLRFTGLK